MSRPAARPSVSRKAALALSIVLAGGAFGGCVRKTFPCAWSVSDREPAFPAGGAAGKSDADPYFQSFIGKLPPDRFVGGSWVNSERRLSLADLRGNVVVLAFAKVACPMCQEFVPHLTEWEGKYAAEGLTTIYVDNGRVDSLAALEKCCCEEGLPCALFHDRLGHMTWAYGVRGFPTVYVIGRDGKVAWEGVGVDVEDEILAAIKEALKR